MDEKVREIMATVKNQTNDFLTLIILPKVEKQIEFGLRGMIEQIIEKKIEERFAFAIELLRSMNDKAKVADGNAR